MIYIQKNILELKNMLEKDVSLKMYKSKVRARVAFFGSEFEFLSKIDDDKIVSYVPRKIFVNLFNERDFKANKYVGSYVYERGGIDFDLRAYILGMDTNDSKLNLKEKVDFYLNLEQIVPVSYVVDKNHERSHLL